MPRLNQWEESRICFQHRRKCIEVKALNSGCIRTACRIWNDRTRGGIIVEGLRDCETGSVDTIRIECCLIELVQRIHAQAERQAV